MYSLFTPYPLTRKGLASFYFALPLPASSKQSWPKDAIWRLVQEVFNPTYLPITIAPPGPSSKPLSSILAHLLQ